MKKSENFCVSIFEKKSKFTKSYIQKVLRTLDKTAIFALFKAVYGYIDRDCIFDFIVDYAPSRKVRAKAYDLAFNSPHDYVESCYKGKYGYYKPLPRQLAVEYTMKQMTSAEITPYTRLPLKGNTHLWFAHPVYEHKDYNKWCSMPISGNEHFVETLLKVVQRWRTTL